MMPRISEAAGLSEAYTNHCVRATTVTVLFQKGVQPQNIMARTGHRSVTGLTPYIGASTSAQKREEATLLQSALVASQAQETVRSESDQIQQSQIIERRVEIDSNAAVQRVVSGTFQNCVFNVNINYK